MVEMKVPLLTAEEEVELAKQADRGDVAAKDRLVQANQGLVVSIVKPYAGRGIEISDLIQAGNEGLVRAIERFDWRHGTRLSTYATSWIRGAIRKTFAQRDKFSISSTQIDLRDTSEAKEPGSSAELKEGLNSALATLTAEERQILILRFGLEDNVQLTPEEVGQELGMSQEQVFEVQQTALQKLRDSDHAVRLKDFLG